MPTVTGSVKANQWNQYVNEVFREAGLWDTDDMRRRRLLMILIGCVVVVIGGWVLWPKTGEPKYQGKTLSEWLVLYEKRSTGELTAAELEAAPQAVRHIGSNALPCLLKWIQPGATPTRAQILFQKLPEALQESVIFRGLSGKREELLAKAAVSGFALLGSSAQPAIPQLVGLASSGNGFYAQLALGQLGRDGVDALLEALTDPGQANRDLLVRWIGEWPDRPTAKAAVPALLKYLGEPDPKVAAESARALGRLGNGNDLVRNALIKSLYSPNSHIRYYAADALAEKEWDKAARSEVPTLIRRLNDPRSAIAAADALGRFAMEPGLVVPALARALKNPDPDVRIAVVRAIENFRGSEDEARLAMLSLFDGCTDPDERVRLEAENAMHSLGWFFGETGESAAFRRRYGLGRAAR